MMDRVPVSIMSGEQRIKVMYLNPAPDIDGQDRIFADMVRENKLPESEVHVASLPLAEGAFTHIEFRSYQAMVTGGILRAVRAAARDGFDALAIGCFYDTALHEAREISQEMVVTAPCVASCEIAASLSNRFGIVIGRRKWVNQMLGAVREYGHESRLSGFYDVELGVNDFHKDRAYTERRLIEAGRRAIEEDFAESLILGCTMETGFYNAMQDALAVPVIDSSIAALKRAEYAALLKRKCGWLPSRKWSSEAPSEDEMTRLARFETNQPFGNRIIVEAT